MFETETDKELQRILKTLNENSKLSKIMIDMFPNGPQSLKLKKGIEENKLLIGLVNLEIERRRTSGWSKQASHSKDRVVRVGKGRKERKSGQ